MSNFEIAVTCIRIFSIHTLPFPSGWMDVYIIYRRSTQQTYSFHDQSVFMCNCCRTLFEQPSRAHKYWHGQDFYSILCCGMWVIKITKSNSVLKTIRTQNPQERGVNEVERKEGQGGD